MAQIVEDSVAWLPPSSRTSSLYPWDEWFDGKTRILTRGDDFICTLTTIRAGIHTAAFRRGKSIRTRQISDTQIQVQAVGKRPRP